VTSTCLPLPLEGRDDLRDRLVLRGVVPFLPPHHEVGGLCAERHHEQRRGEKTSTVGHMIRL
jgi:hypothetical protein